MDSKIKRRAGCGLLKKRRDIQRGEVTKDGDKVVACWRREEIYNMSDENVRALTVVACWRREEIYNRALTKGDITKLWLVEEEKRYTTKKIS